MSAGFYKLDTVQQALAYAPNFVDGPGFSLSKDDPVSKEGMTNGWQWFENDTSAYIHFGMTSTSTPWVCTPLQAKLALHRTGKLEAVEAFIAVAPRDIQIAWEYASEFNRQSPMIIGLAAQLNWSDAELDALFALAKTIGV